jgi:hypothetical protein
MTALAPIAAAAALAAGCGGGDEGAADAAPPAATTKPLPAVADNPLIPGTRYVTERFAPKLSIALPEGAWRTGMPESGELVEFQLLSSKPTWLSMFAFQHIDKVFDPRKGGTTAADAEPAPKDFAAWLRSHPRLKTTPPADVELGGAKGV